MKKKIKSKKTRQRSWYAVFCNDPGVVDYLISARSKHAVVKFMKGFNTKCKIIIARSWTMAHVFSGRPLDLPAPDMYAVNEWCMSCSYEDSGKSFVNVVGVVILN